MAGRSPSPGGLWSDPWTTMTAWESVLDRFCGVRAFQQCFGCSANSVMAPFMTKSPKSICKSSATPFSQ